MKVEFYKHSIDDADIASIIDVLKSPYLTTGNIVNKFEGKLTEIFENKYAVASNSWTNIAFLVLGAWGIKEGDEVIVPSITFASTATIVSRLGAKPVFCDIDPEDGLLDLNKLAELLNPKTKVVIPVHLYGNMVDMQSLKEIIASYNSEIKILEDAAHAFESSFNNKRVGAYSDAAVFSFYATKNLTCGEGGALITNDKRLADFCRIGSMGGTTKSAFERIINGRYQHYDVVQFSGKSNMTNLSASLMINQIERISELHQKRRKVYEKYLSRLNNTPNLKLPKINSKVNSALHLMVVLVNSSLREKVLDDLAKLDIGVTINFKPVHKLKVYKNVYSDVSLPNSEAWGEMCISLPFYPGLTSEEIDYICEYFNTAYQNYFK